MPAHKPVVNYQNINDEGCYLSDGTFVPDRLIAAAPALLEAAEWVVRQSEMGDGPLDIQVLRAAIAQAKGETAHGS